MPHIPEDELHAYLDQALSRSQCVEIESHLAACPKCQSQRDGIAALRDRTTALLAVLAPPMSLPPAFDTIRTRARGLASGRQRSLRHGIWAASVVVALGLGWTAHVLLEETPGQDQAFRISPETTAAQPFSVPDSARSSSSFDEPPSTRLRGPTAEPSREIAETPDGQNRPVADSSIPRIPLPPVQNVAADPQSLRSDDSARFASSNSTVLSDDRGLAEMEPESMWRLVSVAEAEEESGAPLPSVQGLPVVQVKVQGVRPNEKIVAVDQQLANGRVIRTIEGPAPQMTDLLARDGQRPADAAINASRALDVLMTMRFGDRIIAIRGPADSVRALMNRLPVPQGKKP